MRTRIVLWCKRAGEALVIFIGLGVIAMGMGVAGTYPLQTSARDPKKKEP